MESESGEVKIQDAQLQPLTGPLARLLPHPLPRPLKVGEAEAYDADAVIVSCHGRGNWLACELTNRAWRVVLVDVSGSLEAGQAEDLEGPFGFFASGDLAASQIPHKDEADSRFQLLGEGKSSELTPCPLGFVIWLKSGPIELSGPLAKFHLQKLKLAPSVDSFLDLLPRTANNARQVNRVATQIDKCGFQESWLAHFAAQFAAPFMSESHSSVYHSEMNGRALDLKAPLWIRRVSQSSSEVGLAACEQIGVKVRRQVSIQALRTGQAKSLFRSRAKLDVLEFSTDRAGGSLTNSKAELKARAFVWMLSGLETDRLPEAVKRKIFQGGKASPSWYWTRYQMALCGGLSADGDSAGDSDGNRAGAGADEFDQLPMFAVVIEDHDLPWTHSNAFVWRKRLAVGNLRPEFDIWVRLPVRAAGDLIYRQEIGREVERLMTARMPLFKPKILTEHAAMKNVIDPVRHAITDEASILKPSDSGLMNLFLAGPDTWSSLDATSRMKAQTDALVELEKLKTLWLAAEAKAAVREKR